MAKPINPRLDLGTLPILLEVPGSEMLPDNPSLNPETLDCIFDTWFRQAHPRRAECEDRGYHKISELSSTDPQVCYHCELFFGKDQGTEYRIYPDYQ